MAAVPDDLTYTAEHEWARTEPDGSVRVGITDFAQDALGDVVFVSLPDVGAQVSGGQSLGEIESTKSVSEFYAPFDGEVVARNDELDSRPDLLNSDPYGEGWIVTIRPTTDDAAQGLLSAAAYQGVMNGGS
jgi:glycine cleavage system H protein